MKLRDHFMSKVAAGMVALTLTTGGAAFVQAQDNAPADSTANITNDAWLNYLNPGNYELDPHRIVSPEYDLQIIGGAAALFAVLCLAGVARRRKGSLPMLVAGVAVVGALANPSFVKKEEDRRPTEVAVVVDESASQNVGTRATDTQSVVDNVLEQLHGLGINDANIHVVRTDGRNERLENGGTNIFAELPDNLSAVVPHQYGATIMISDGQIHDVPEDLSGVLARAPFYGLISGEEEERDRYIDLENVPLYGLVDEEQEISFRIVDEGVPENELQAVNVTVSLDGKIHQRMSVIPNELTVLRFKVPHGGENIIEIEATGLEDELTLRNNKAVLSVEGVRDTMRVLLAAGQPYIGSVSWRMALKSDPNIDLVHFNILRGPGQGAGNVPVDEMSLIAFPTRELFEEKINDFDLIIMDSFEIKPYLLRRYAENVKKYVEEGGALLVVADNTFSTWNGIGYSPLEDILPAKRKRTRTPSEITDVFRPEISDYGQRFPATRGLAETQNPEEWGRWTKIIEVGDVTGDVLMEGHDGKPLLIMNRAGKGRAALLTSNQPWLWQRGVDGGGPYLELLRNIAHWTMKEPALEEEALRLDHKGGVVTVQRQTMANVDALPVATVTDPEGDAHEVPLTEIRPGLWQGQMNAGEPGLYEAAHQEFKTATSVGLLDPLEYRNILSTTERLAPLAEKTGGSVQRFNRSATGAVSAPTLVALKAGETAGNGEIGIRMNEETILRSSERQPLSPWWYYGVAMAFAAFAFFRESEARLGRNKAAKNENSSNDKSENGQGPKPTGP